MSSKYGYELELKNLKNIVNDIPCAIFWKDINSVFLGCNKKFAEFAGPGIMPKDIIGKTDNDILLWTKEQSDSYRRDDDIVIVNKVKLNYEEHLQQKDGSENTMLVSKAPLLDENQNVVGLICIYTDIHSHKKTEKELEISKKQADLANQAKSEFLAIISHELRIPLTGILGILDVLINEKISAIEMASYLESLSISGEHLLSLVNDILSFTKLESEDFQVILDPFDIKKLIENSVIPAVSAPAVSKKLDLHVEYAPNIPFCVVSDNWVLKRILINLLGNAIKFTDHGSIHLKVDCVEQNATQAKFIFTVTDTGIGIPDDKLNVIFDFFQQIHPVYTQRSSQMGTGLGLAITKKLIDLLNGTISVKSELNRGSIFTCLLEFALHDSTTLVTSSSTAQNISPSFVRVLLVEDDSLIQMIYEKYLTKLGCEFMLANTGEKALEIAEKNRFDLIFMDVGLPGLDGLQVAKMIRQMESGSKNAFIVGLTGYSDYETQRRCFAAGMNDVLIKPIKIAELKRLIEIAAQHVR